MSEHINWADKHNDRLNRIHELVDEIIDNHRQMQTMLSEALVKCQVERGMTEIENFLKAEEA